MPGTGDDLSRDEIVERSRSRKEDVADDGEGIRLPATEPSVEDGIGFLGVDEQVVPPDLRGRPAPPIQAPDADDEDGSRS